MLFLQHELAGADLHLSLTDVARRSGAQVAWLQLEPDCWRRYVSPLGTLLTLKPDLALGVETDQYLSSYLFELDRPTEPPGRIVVKAQQYQEYHRTGEEARRSGIAPQTIWVVPSSGRRDQLLRHLGFSRNVIHPLHRVLLFDEIWTLFDDDESRVGVVVPRTGEGP